MLLICSKTYTDRGDLVVRHLLWSVLRSAVVVACSLVCVEPALVRPIPDLNYESEHI